MPYRTSILLILTILELLRNGTMPENCKAGEVETRELSNGLRIFFLEKHTAPVVAVQVWYQAGSVNERDGIRGIAHLFEHMMFRGSEHFESEEHARLIHDVGGSCNAFTTEHVTVFHQSVPAGQLELVLKLEADRMTGLKLNQDVLNTEREVVEEEYHRYHNNPFARAFFEFRKRLYTRHPYHWTPLGELDDLSAMTVENCKEFYQSNYVPNNAALIVCGDVTVEKALPLIQKYFGEIRRRDVPSTQYEMEPEQTAAVRIPMKLPIEVPVVAMAFRIPEASHEDMPVLVCLDWILSSGESARLDEEIVKARPIAVQTGGYLLVNKDPGVYTCFAAYLPSRREKTVVHAVLEQIRRLQENGIEDEELKAAKNRLLSEKVFEHYSADSLALDAGMAAFIEGDISRFREQERRIEAVTAEDIQRVANTYLQENRMSILSVKPERFRLTYWLAGLFYALRR